MGKKAVHPPKLFLRFFRWYCDPEMIDFIEGDLMEVYHKRLQKGNKRKADMVFIAQVMLLFRPGIIRQSDSQGNSNSLDMIGNYYKTGWRNLWRSKLHSTLNITGLTMGIACFLLIGLYVFDELTFDQGHEKAPHIYRVVEHKNDKGEVTTVAAAGFKLSDEAKNQIPEVESTTRMQRHGRANLVDPENPVPFQETVTVADENFFRIFDFPLIVGDRNTVLKEPASIVINEELAMRVFGRTDVIGKSLQFNHMPEVIFKITGLMKNHPRNSSFNFNNVVSEATYYQFNFFQQTRESDWTSGNFTVYALLRPASNPDSTANKMTRMVKANVVPEDGVQFHYTLQPLKDVHLKSQGILDGARNSNVESIPSGNPLYITIFTFTGLFVLLISGINYTNLTTARASGRVKEIGVRKAIGAVRSNLIGQFLFESLLTTLIALVLSILLVSLTLPAFNQFANKQLSLFSVDYRFWLSAVGGVIIIGFMSGSYAALLLSRLRPVALLKGLKVQSKGDLSVRKFLVVFQFTISIVMMIGTIVLLMQVRFLNSTDLGFNKDLMVVIDVNTGAARSQFEVIKDGMSKISSVKSVSVSSRVPGEWKTIRICKAKTEGSAADPLVTYFIGADQDFLGTFEVKLLQGRNFNSKSDSMTVMLNETAARLLNIKEVAGQVIEIPERMYGASFGSVFPNNPMPFKPRLIGIVKDFHFQSLHDRIEPLILGYNNNPIHGIDYYTARIDPNNIQSTLDQLKEPMVKADPDEPFEYHFLDDQLRLFYVEDERRQTILGWTAFAAIAIACLGLFGLATYSIEQRVKEIGIRKVLGASVVGVVSLLSRDFIRLVLIASVLAFPIAWFGVNRWLQEYAYHIEVGWWIFIVAGLAATFIALGTISYQAFKSARANPVNSLRSE